MGQDAAAEGLSPAAKKALETKRLGGRLKLKEWLRLLEELAAFDAATDQLIERTRSRMIGLILALIGTVFVGGIIGLFVAFFLFAIHPLIGVLFVLLAIGGLVWFGVVTARTVNEYTTLKEADLDNGFRDLALPLLQELSEDVAPGAKVQLALDMTPPNAPGKVVRRTNLPPGRFQSLRLIEYYNPWFHVGLPLRSGGELVIDVKDRLFEQERQWYNARGKWKVKRKYKRVVIASANLAPDPNRFTWDQGRVQQLAAAGGFKLQAKGPKWVGRLTRKAKYKGEHVLGQGGVPKSWVKPQDVVGMAMELHGALSPVAQQ